MLNQCYMKIGYYSRRDLSLFLSSLPGQSELSFPPGKAATRGVAYSSSSLSTTVANLGEPRHGSEGAGVRPTDLITTIVSSSTAASLPLSLSEDDEEEDEELKFEQRVCHDV